jgi:hypothetical protein
MRYKCIACEVLARPVYLSAAHSPHIIDVTLVRYGLHSTPKKLRETLQGHIDAVESEAGYDAILLAYGLCGKATDGLQARELPVVLPRAHDCITLFLGGRERYDAQFAACPGTYWYVQDFIERGDADDIPLSIGAKTAADADALYEEYVQKYGRDNADYLMEAMGAWQAHYERAAYIDMPVGDGQNVANQAQADANRRGWRFEQLAGDLVLIKRLLDGDWDEDFLQLPPGETIRMVGGEDIVRGEASPLAAE